MPHPRRRPRPAAALVLLVLLLATAWSVTRSGALGEAEAAYSRATDPPGLSRALRLALDHLDRQPWSRGASLIAARCLSRLDFVDAAEPYYRRLGTLDLSDMHLRAYAILRANRRDRAIEAYRDILRSHPDDVEASRILGGIYYSRKQYDDALAEARRLIANPLGVVQGHRLAATVYHEDALPEQAVGECERVLELDPRLESIPAEAQTVFWLSYTSDLLQLGRAGEARRLLTGLLAGREEPWIRAELGRAASQLGDFDQAEREWTRVSEQRPEAAEPWYELGRIALARTPPDPAKAAEFLERADSLVPSDYRVLFLLRNAYLRLDRKADADALIGRIDQARLKAKPAATGIGRGSSSQP